MPEGTFNVREPWEEHDTIVVAPTLYGSEAQAGYFTTFAAFGQQMKHLFFKRRSEGNVHRAYCNKQSEDRTDFVFHVFQVGLLFIGPPTPLMGRRTGIAGVTEYQEFAQPFWLQDLPRHCAATLSIGQDTNLQLNAMMLSPGYGPHSNGAAYGLDTLVVAGQTFENEAMWTATQGVPEPQCRYWVAGDPQHPKPTGIPKNEIVELSLEISEHARGILTSIAGPQDMFSGPITVATPT
ncbi:MAG: hypothetical protein PHD68_02155, partial [Rugosibacter sp.]|nr:hypothetical protein [Rugosibacter sp.]